MGHRVLKKQQTVKITCTAILGIFLFYQSHLVTLATEKKRKKKKKNIFRHEVLNK